MSKPLTLSETRTMFRIRTLMMPATLDMKNDPKFAGQLWKCDQCQRIDSESHVLWCPFFAPLRERRVINENWKLFLDGHFKSNKLFLKNGVLIRPYL